MRGERADGRVGQVENGIAGQQAGARRFSEGIDRGQQHLLE